MSDENSKLLQWSQPVITVVSLVFGVGILYGDVQEMKREVDSNKPLREQVQVMETRLEMQDQISQKQTVALEKVVDQLTKLNTSVAKLEAKLER